MRKFSALFLIIPLLLAGCHKNYQMDDLMFAKVLGIDFDGETYTVTVGLKDSSKESEDSKVVKTECKSVSEGINKLSQKADKRIFLNIMRSSEPSLPSPSTSPFTGSGVFSGNMRSSG